MQTLMCGHLAHPHTVNRINTRPFSLDPSITLTGGGLNNPRGVFVASRASKWLCWQDCVVDLPDSKACPLTAVQTVPGMAVQGWASLRHRLA